MTALDELPEYPELVGLADEHRVLLADVFREVGPIISEATFAYQWLWRPYTDCHLSRFRGLLVLICTSAKTGETYAFAPFSSDAAEAAAAGMEILNQDGPVIRLARVPEPIAGHLKGTSSVRLTEIRDRADYVHRTDQLSELPGSAFHAKRNQIRQFHRACPDAEYRAIDPDLAEACSAFSQRWLEEHPKRDLPALQREVNTTRRMLDHMDWLGIEGGALLRQGKVIAFALGEQLNDETMVERVEKADTSYPGTYQAINQAFARNVAAGYKWINREQDMGVRGLRRAKKSYRPDHLVRKYELRIGS
jgi:hypothetical protein